jgi:hypothetical protein
VTGTPKEAGGKSGRDGAQHESFLGHEGSQQSHEEAHLAIEEEALGGESDETVQIICAEEAQGFDSEVTLMNKAHLTWIHRWMPSSIYAGEGGTD